MDAQTSLRKNTISQEPLLFEYINGPRREKTCLRGFANNIGADKPAHPQSDQRLCYWLTGKNHSQACFERNFTILASLCS